MLARALRKAAAADRLVRSEVIAAVVVAGSEKAAAHRLRLTLDRQAPPGETAVQGGRDDDRAAVLVPGLEPR